MAKLVYFDGRGRGEIIRLTLAAAEIEFTEVLLTERDQLLKLIDDGKLAFGQLPLLEIDGKTLVQSMAIVRYIGRKAHLCGKTEDDHVKVDIYLDSARDFFNAILPIGFLPEETVLTQIKAETLPKYLSCFEKILAANNTGYLVGDSLTVADIGLIEALLLYTEYLGKDILTDYPAVLKFFDTVSANRAIAAYLAGPQRKRKNDARYVEDVKRVLGKN